MKTQKQNAIIYCRADLNENTDEIFIINNQERQIKNFCENRGFNVVKIFTDLTTNKNKTQPELQNLKDFAMQSETTIDVVVCSGFDRIARTFEKVLDVMIEFNKIGIDVISVQQITNLNNKSNEQNN